MKKETKKEPKYLTEGKFGIFENKFEKMLNQHEKAFLITLKEIQAFREETKEYRERIRVERLEMQMK